MVDIRKSEADRGSPVQILEFLISEKNGERSSVVQLNTEKLTEVCSKGGDRPSILISIAGPSRKGKSFFLGFLLRYFNALTLEDVSDWIGSEDQDAPLTGFKWGGGYDIQTTGIWIWDRPFVIKVNGEKEYVVFLMDTQGVFDEQTDQRDWCRIIGISLLMSSCTILNIPDLLEDSLLMLESFITYGLLVNDGRTGSVAKPFQRLLFLLRDWNNPQEFEYGKLGGQNFLTKKLEVEGKLKMSSESRNIRINIRSCFEELNCFLLPPPGEKIKVKQFNGALKDLDKKFIKYVRECVESQFNPYEIKPIVIAGMEIKARNLPQYFGKYVELFNNEDLPKPVSLHEATVQITNSDLIQRLFDDQYKNKIKTLKLNDHSFIERQNLEELHQNLKPTTLAAYKKHRKLGDEKVWKGFSEKLEKQIDVEFAGLVSKNNSRIQISLAREVGNNLQEYIDCVKLKISDSYFLEEDEFEHISDERGSTFIKEYKSIFMHENEIVVEPFLKELKSKISKAEEELKIFNQLMRTKAEHENEKIVQELANSYSTFMTSLQSESGSNNLFVPVKRLVKNNEDAKLDLKNKINETAFQGNDKMIKLYKQKLDDTVLAKYNEYVSTNYGRVKAYLVQEVGNHLQQYKDSIKNKITESYFLEEDEFKNISDEKSSKLVGEFKGIFENEDEMLVEPFLRELKEKIYYAKEELTRFNQLIVAKAEHENEKIVQELANSYSKFMTNHQSDSERDTLFVPTRRLEKDNDDAKLDLKEKIKRATFRGNKIMIKVYEEKLNELVEKNYNEIVRKNSGRIQVSLAQEVGDKLLQYKNSVNNHIAYSYCLEEDEFKTISNEKGSKFIAEFLSLFENEDEILVAQFLKELKEKISNAEEELKIINQLIVTKSEHENEKIVQELVNSYSQFMTNLQSNSESKTMLAPFKKLEKDNNDAKLDLKQKLTGTIFQGNDKMINLYKQKLDEAVEEKYNQLFQKNEYNRKQLELELDKFSNDSVKQLEGEMKNQMTYWKELTEAKMMENLEKTASEIQNKFMENMNSKNGEVEFYQPWINAFIEMVEQNKSRVVNDYYLKLKEYISSIQDNLIEKYSTTIERSILNYSSLHPKMNDFILLSESTAKMLLEEYETILRGSLSEEMAIASYTDELFALISKSEARFNKQFETKIIHFQAYIGDLINESKEYYQREMLPFVAENLPSDESEFEKVHSDMVCKAKEMFLSSIEVNLDLEEIETGTQDAYEQLLPLFKLKKKEQAESIKKKMDEAKQFYSEEIAKHLDNNGFLEQALLQKCHQSALADTVRKFGSEFSKSVIESLTKDLETIFKTYENLNYMNTPTTDIAIGIDLGTTYSCVAVYLNGKVDIIQNNGHNTTPSYVCIQDSGNLVGYAAKSQAFNEPENTIYDIKRLIGLPFFDEGVQKDIKTWDFTVIEENQVPKIKAHNKIYEPEQISALVLKQLKEAAQDYLKCEVKNAVITVPAYFTDGQKQATIDAGKIAGLNVLKIVPEPAAAAIAYRNLQRKIDTSERKVLIYDLGGGTFDVAILDVKGVNVNCIEIGGNNHLGGEDFDQNIVEYCLEQHKKSTGVDLKHGKYSVNGHDAHQYKKTVRRIRDACEREKRHLSTGKHVNILVDVIDYQLNDLQVPLSRQKFEELNQNLFDYTIKEVEKVLSGSGLDKGEIDDVVLVGGSTRIPKIREMLTDYFGGKALNKALHADEAVAYGAAILAAVFNGGVDPESCDYTSLTYVTPRSLGIETLGGVFSIIIPKSTQMPITKERKFITIADNQAKFECDVYEGENRIACENHFLGTFHLDGIPPNGKGKEEMLVQMNINDEGILHVTATSVSTGGTTNLTITEKKLRLSADRIEKLISDGV